MRVQSHTFELTNVKNLRLQSGGSAFHSPLSPQVRVSAPTSSKSGLQAKVAVSPAEVPEKATEPLAGSTRIGQRARMRRNEVHSSAKIAAFRSLLLIMCTSFTIRSNSLISSFSM